MAAAVKLNRVATLRPVLKWAGGKRWLLPQLRQLWGDSRARRLVEPFCGGLSVALGLMPSQALLNDINPHAMNFYRWLKKGLRIKSEMRNEADSYYTARAKFNALIASRRDRTAEAAGLFYYLNRTGYNGLCRFNSDGRFNVPFGRHRRINYTNDFSAYRCRFANWKFSAMDFARIEAYDSDFIYADPPYDVEFIQYSKEAFIWEDQIRLAEWLMRHRGPVVLSNQATDRIVQLYERCGFTLTYLTAPRRISCTGDRSPAKEVLATKNL
ncbi:MAG TPA: Dam family site-specific DNA-(adenine-N6)-methyltransferase [Candidatus Binataceae bacterium]|nr:Dam family site-specific DNA-(adenine-N6)-methyltransferase [Candidatus Binataceae bacterium]